ncbi:MULTISPECIES: hypothetical protein [Aeromonas]|uniref:hypothetical protein n=1 Tax=Aeromonas TaxID=642 RepID=UPI000CDD5B10|nr:MULTISPECIES: hypothetical protein [Aeromonas]AUZ76196.1 hypothetical protein C2U40_16025 [Aeromonas sp. ASNIH4]POU40904.1 hypothetical protein C3405_05165 [Aeromonas hydrophila]POV90096.1 hypothetical protein C3395_05200 [Aeromonas sp. ASNIH6]
MITEDFTLANKLFAIVDEGIVDGYDFFSYKIDIGDGYIDAVLTVENEGVITTDAKRDINNAEVLGIMMKLKGNSISRGDNWRTLIISYRHGEQVKLNFNQ